jgi:hypothetical protein
VHEDKHAKKIMVMVCRESHAHRKIHDDKSHVVMEARMGA